MKKLIFLLFLFIGLCGNAQNTALFDRANEAYANGNYAVAVEHYNSILENGETSAAVHYNLGNAYYKLNRVAPSIYHFEKALQLDPGDEDIQNNLEFARNMAIDAIEETPSEGFYGIFDSSTSAFSPSAWGWIAVTGMILFVAFFLTYYFSRRAMIKRIFFISAFVFLFFAVASAGIGIFKHNAQQEESFAIVFSEEVEVKSEPNSRSAESFTLHEGAKVEILENYQEWSRIRLANGNQGWLRTESLRRL